jgi:peptidoglycan/LPS O-acetylase OafA/YrhL
MYTARKETSIKYRPEIDGLRAVAIIAVIFFHFKKGLLPGGFIGVDIFFVISGFLITSIIRNDYENGIFSFINFWLRRVRRILPALVTAVFVILAASLLILYPPDINEAGTQGMASLLSFANISHWLLSGNYWGPKADDSPFLHVWSLSIEEQFYFIFPLLLFLTLKFFRKWITPIFIFSIFSSLILFIYGTQIKPVATFYLLPARAWELGIGAWLAIYLFKKHFRYGTSNLIAGTGFLAVLLSCYFVHSKNGATPLLIVPVLGAAIVIMFASGDRNFVKTILSFPPAVYIGKISYSLYLWHWPVLLLSKQLSLKYAWNSHPMLVLGVILMLASLSYHFVETPLRYNNKYVPYTLIFLCLGVIFSYSLYRWDFTKRILPYHRTEWNANPYNVIPIREYPAALRKKMQGITLAPWGSNSDIHAYANGGVQKLYGKAVPEIVILGDSHALMWSRILDEMAKESGKSIGFYAADGAPTFFNIPPVKRNAAAHFFSADQLNAFDNARFQFLKEWKPKTVVISCRWSSVKNLNTMSDLIEFLGGLGSQVFFIEDPPELDFSDKNAPAYFSYLGFVPSAGKKQYLKARISPKCLNGIQVIQQAVERYPFCKRIPISELFLNNTKAWIIDSFDVLYIDDDHLSYAGSLKAKDRIVSALRPIL